MGTYRQPSANIDKSHGAITKQLESIGDDVMKWGKAVSAQRQKAAQLKAKQLKEQQALIEKQKKQKATITSDITDLTQQFNELNIDPNVVVAEFGTDQLSDLKSFLNANPQFIKSDNTVDIDKLKTSDDWRDFRQDTATGQPSVSKEERTVTGLYLDNLKPGMTVDDITSQDNATTYTLQNQSSDLMKGYLKMMEDIGDSKDARYIYAKKSGENLIKNFNLTNQMINETIGNNYNDAYTDPGGGMSLTRKHYTQGGAFLKSKNPNNKIFMSLTDDVKTGSGNSPWWGISNSATSYALTYEDPDLNQTLVMGQQELEKYISTIGKGKGFLGQVDANAPTLMLDFIYKPSAKSNAGGLNAGKEYEALMEVITTKDQQGNITKETVIENYAKANEYMKNQINSFVETSMPNLPFDQIQSTYQLFDFESKGLGEVYEGTDAQKEAMKIALYDEFTNKYSKGNADEVLKKLKITDKDIRTGQKNYTKDEAKKIASNDGINIYGGDADTEEIRNILKLEDDAIAFDLKDVKGNTKQFLNDKESLAKVLNSLKKTNKTSGGQLKKYMTGKQIKQVDPSASVEDDKLYQSIGKTYNLQNAFNTTDANQLYKAIEDNILNALGRTGSTVTGVVEDELENVDVAIQNIDLNDPDALRNYYQNRNQQA